MNDHQQIVLDMVTKKPGIKGTELITEILTTSFERELTNRPTDLPSFIDSMVANGDLVEVEYVLPSINYRVKSLYFPKGTEVKICAPIEEQV